MTVAVDEDRNLDIALVAWISLREGAAARRTLEQSRDD
jgi:hypothetical protein